MIEVGQQHREEFSYTQQQITDFANFTNDTNPLHINAEYAAKTPFKKPIMPSVLSAGVLSKLFGINFPGEGSVYISQQLNFKRPMFADIIYEVTVTVKSVNREKHVAVFNIEITDKTTGKACIIGEAEIINKEKI